MMTDRLHNRNNVESAVGLGIGRSSARRGFSLAELIIAIALLSLFGVIAARMFFVADGLSQKTEQLDQAVILAANIAEVWQEASTEESLKTPDNYAVAGFRAEEFTSDLEHGRKWQTALDSDLKPSSDVNAAFVLTVQLEQTEQEDVWQMSIAIGTLDSDTSELVMDNLIFELTASRYFPSEVTR